MHYGIVAIGSRGDVQPYIALALGLQDRGHEATLLAHENFKPFVEGYGVRFHALSGSVEDLLKTEEGMAMLRSGSFFAFIRYLQSVVSKTQATVNQDILSGCKKADILVSSLLGIPWVDAVAEKLNLPWAIVQLNLPSSCTAAFPLPGFDFFDFPAYNRLTYRIMERIHWQLNKKPVNAFRRKLGLPPLKIPILKKITAAQILNLHCFSPVLRTRPTDWEPHIDITGFLFLPEAKRAASSQDDVPAELRRWMADGLMPIYIGFGSIPVPDPHVFKTVMAVLLNTTSHRFVFCEGWSLPMNLPEHPHLFQLKKVNHDWLFPRCKAAIIHGGIGTVAAALKAQIPLIILSVIADQPWWGEIMEAKGAGIHIPFKQLTAEKLSSAITAVEEPLLKQQAFLLGEQINREDGLGKTIESLNQYAIKSIEVQPGHG